MSSKTRMSYSQSRGQKYYNRRNRPIDVSKNLYGVLEINKDLASRVHKVQVRIPKIISKKELMLKEKHNPSLPYKEVIHELPKYMEWTVIKNNRIVTPKQETNEEYEENEFALAEDYDREQHDDDFVDQREDYDYEYDEDIEYENDNAFVYDKTKKWGDYSDDEYDDRYYDDGDDCYV